LACWAPLLPKRESEPVLVTDALGAVMLARLSRRLKLALDALMMLLLLPMWKQKTQFLWLLI
jgi:hypothetical protein